MQKTLHRTYYIKIVKSQWLSKADRKNALTYKCILGFPSGSEVKATACNAGDLGSIPGLGRFPWRRKWQPTPVFLPGESHGQRSLVGYSPRGHKESDTTEWLHSLTHSLTQENKPRKLLSKNYSKTHRILSLSKHSFREDSTLFTV